MINNMENMMLYMFGILMVIAVILLVVYIVMGIYLNKLNVILYGRKTPMAWVPITNIYLLGKLTFNKIVGWILIGWMFLNSKTTVTVNGVSKTSSILPENINALSNRFFGIACIILIIYSIVKYYHLRNTTNNSIDNSSNQVINQNIPPTTENLNVPSNNITNNISQNNSENNIEEQKQDDFEVVQEKTLEEKTIDPTSWDFGQLDNVVNNNSDLEEINPEDFDDKNNISS